MIEELMTLIGRFTPESDILLLLGLALFAGSLGGKLFNLLKIPQVVGYILIGLLAGHSGLNIIKPDAVMHLKPFSYFALGLIGFMVGGELKKSTLLKQGRSLVSILLAESLTSFVVVTTLVTCACLFFVDGKTAISLGLVLGSISAATAPAATTDVLWEYKCRGPLTTTILGIVALDDAIALALFAIATSIASSLLGSGGDLKMVFILPVYEIGGAILLGTLAGYILKEIVKRSNDDGKILANSIGAVLLVVAVARALHVDFLLASMTVGVFVTNFNPRKTINLFNIVEKFTPPIYIVFFVLFGASMNISNLSMYSGVVVVYLIGRTAGKMFGARIGAILGGAPDTVKRYLPYCLFSQAGVAIGLSIMAGQNFDSSIGETIVVVITGTTFVVQLIGPSMVKFAVTKAGEVGRNITEEEMMDKIIVRDVMFGDVPPLLETSLLSDIITAFSKGPNLSFPVLGKDKNLLGIITVEHIKDVLSYSDLGSLLLAHDIMEPVDFYIHDNVSLSEAKSVMNSRRTDSLPVLDMADNFVGIIEVRVIETTVALKIAAFREQA